MYAERFRMIGRKIAFYRSLREMTQEELSRKSGVSLSYIKKIESGKSARAFSLYILFLLSDVLEVSILELVRPVPELAEPISDNM